MYMQVHCTIYKINKMHTCAHCAIAYIDIFVEDDRKMLNLLQCYTPSCAKRSLMRVLSALSVVFQVSAQ